MFKLLVEEVMDSIIQIFLHANQEKRVNLHGNQKESSKNTRFETEGEKKNPAIRTSVWKLLMAGTPLFLGIFGQKKGR